MGHQLGFAGGRFGAIRLEVVDMGFDDGHILFVRFHLCGQCGLARVHPPNTAA